MTAPEGGRLTWAAEADRAALAADGWQVVEWSWLQQQVVARAQASAGRRTDLASPVASWLDTVASAPRLAVVGVRLDAVEDLAALHGYVLEPAVRAGGALLVQCAQRLTRLDPGRFVDPGFDHPWTLERALAAAMELHRGAPPASPRDDVPAAAVALDAEQQRAVDAHDGVVQVIAPAGSGKTTVLIGRVRELLRRGAPARGILCTTFNRDARVELQERLRAAGLAEVEARTFHSLGLWLLKEEGLVRAGGTRSLSLGQWRRICALAAGDGGSWVQPADARAAVSEIKLGALATPAEFRHTATEREDGETLARIYALYEQQLAEQDVNDFDDQIMLAVRALRRDPDLRRRWQARFTHVLVDEYQDIEPAQELLVRILAAPQDAFFSVGDEDQTLYGWRRASARRMIELDLAYPGLERVSLAHNYRCPPAVVAASRRLIERNRIRFPKQIEPAPGRAADDAALRLEEADSRPHAAARTAHALAGHARGEIVVLARTTNLLRAVALACVDAGVRISAPAAVFEPRGAREALEAYLRVCGDPGTARAQDVAVVCRAPSRGLPFGAEEQVAGRLRDGASFAEAFAAVPADARRRERLDDGARALDALARLGDAARFIGHLRRAGGLDQHFTEYEETFGDAERVELEVLEEAQREAADRSVAEYEALLRGREDALHEIRDDEHGIELTTIHRAKGRQWPQVHVFACEEGQLPHRRALDVTPARQAAGEGVEAERRLAYVAFTRAQERLVVTTTETAASRFLTEAGLQPARPYQPPAPAPEPMRLTPRAPVKRSGGPRPRGTGPAAAGLAEAERVGLGYALRTAADRATALELAAAAIEQRLVGPMTTSESMTVGKLLGAIEGLADSDHETVVRAAGLASADVIVARLDAGARPRLVRALRAL